MKKILLMCAVSFTAIVAHSQFYKSILPSPEFSGALEKIVLDFRFNYETIKGDSIMKEGPVETFQSAVKLPGASDCIISYYNSKLDTTASWQASMYRGESYKAAARTYENVFRMVKKSHIRWIDRTSIGFKGEMTPASENLRFAASTLYFELEDKRYQTFVAEVQLQPTNEGWEVVLNFQSKKPDTEGSEAFNNEQKRWLRNDAD